MMSSSNINSPRKGRKAELPPLFWYMELGDWEKAAERVRRHPREVKTWATLRTKTDEGNSGKGTKRLALHHACFKLRTAGALSPAATKPSEDAFVEVCRFILMLVRLYPEAAGQRESRHGCLPLHLAAFASCAPRMEDEDNIPPSPLSKTAASIAKPGLISRRVASDATSATTDTNMSAMHAEETYTGEIGDKQIRRSGAVTKDPNVSVSMRPNIYISSKREEMAVQVMNALLDAYPKAIRVDSEGGRLPLHTACAGRATPRVISTLVTAYPSAARHRNKDGFLPLHLAAHWGVSHPNVAITLLKAYPDATVGRNRWERTPLEEALCMAGENGRPHQAAMVRALRKHPSYWTRPTSELLNGGPRGRSLAVGTATIVDVDESLPSNDSTTLEDQKRYFSYGHDPLLDDPVEKEREEGKEAGAAAGLLNKLSPRSKAKKIQESKDSNMTLAELIKKFKWESVLMKLEANPLESEEELEVMTRGGFMASSGFTPLHYACERNPPVEVVQALIGVYPVAVLTRMMPGGCLPLHLACTWGSCPEVVLALLSADHGSAKITDELGNVALHSACFSGASLQVVEALLDADGNAVLSRNHQGSRPIDICKRLRHEDRRRIMAKLTYKKESVLKKHRPGRSSGTLSEIASQALELNEAHGTPGRSSGKALDREGDMDMHEQAIEVAYQGQDKQELLWI